MTDTLVAYQPHRTWLNVEVEGLPWRVLIEWPDEAPYEWVDHEWRIDDSERRIPIDVLDNGYYSILLDKTDEAFREFMNESRE